jgi:hypothetical protein
MTENVKDALLASVARAKDILSDFPSAPLNVQIEVNADCHQRLLDELKLLMKLEDRQAKKPPPWPSTFMGFPLVIIEGQTELFKFVTPSTNKPR